MTTKNKLSVPRKKKVKQDCWVWFNETYKQWNLISGEDFKEFLIKSGKKVHKATLHIEL